MADSAQLDGPAAERAAAVGIVPAHGIELNLPDQEHGERPPAVSHMYCSYQKSFLPIIDN